MGLEEHTLKKKKKKKLKNPRKVFQNIIKQQVNNEARNIEIFSVIFVNPQLWFQWADLKDS